MEQVKQVSSLLISEFCKCRQTKELTINQLSYGEAFLLMMIGKLAWQLAIANPSLNNPLLGQAIVLIDEIELHLHPGLHRAIVPFLTEAFPNCQFIFTTNSPQVLSQVKPEGILILEKENDRIVVKEAESSYGRDSNRILEDLMCTPKRPQDIKDRLHELFRLIDEKNLESAKQACQELMLKIGDDPEIVAAEASIRRYEILKGKS